MRRLIRRAIRYAKLLGIDNPFVLFVGKKIITIFQSVYPELAKNKEKILFELTTEENKFAAALDVGIKEFRKLIYGKVASGVITSNTSDMAPIGDIQGLNGSVLFSISSTYGFPLEMCLEELNNTITEAFPYRLSQNRNITKELEERLISEFNEEFKKHQDLSRTASAGQFKGGLADDSEEVTKLHTATHLLHKALIDVLGIPADQKGSNITSERLRFDFECPRKVTSEELAKIEEIVNQKIQEDLPVHFEVLSVEEAKATGAIGIFEDKYAALGGKIKVYFVGDYSKEICGGPHVEHTGVIGKFKIQKEEAVSAGVRRIKAVIS